MEGRPATNRGNNLSTVSVPVEKAHEIVERLAVRRRFYRGGFFIFCGHRRVRHIDRDWHHPQRLGLHARVGRFEPLGTAAVLWWLYIARETSLYADAGRELLGGK